MKFKRAFLIFLVLILLVDLSFFSAAYFFNTFVPSWYLMLIPYVIIAMISGALVKVHIVKKVLLMIIVFAIGVVSGFILLFSTMFLPGSKEHNYVMYRVCLPELRVYYKSKGKSFSLDEKGWKEHTLCEQNVWSGKEPLTGIN